MDSVDPSSVVMDDSATGSVSQRPALIEIILILVFICKQNIKQTYECTN